MKAIANAALVFGVLLTLCFFLGPFEVPWKSPSHDFAFMMVSEVGLVVGFGLIILGSILLFRARQKAKDQ